MAQWKKVIVSGSAAQLSSLAVQGAGQTGYITNRSTVAGTRLTGSFSGSFKGDGSQLTNIPTGAVTTYNNAAANRIITSVNSTTIQGEANLSFTGTRFSVTGSAGISGGLTGSGVRLNSLPAGTTNTVIVQTAGNNLATRTVDARVWGSSLVDGTGASTRIAYWSDADTLTSTAAFTTDGTNVTLTGTLNANGGTIATNQTTANVVNATATTVNFAGAGTNITIGSATGATKVRNNLEVSGSVFLGDASGDNIILRGASITTPNLPSTGNTNDVVTKTAGNALQTRTIDSRVWGSSLVDGSGAATRVTYWTDADTVTSNASFTYDGTNLTVGSSTFGTNVSIAGNLTVLGSTTNLNISNLNVADRFILLNSGSATGDGGIIVQNNAATKGFAFAFDDSADRWGFQGNILLHATGSVLTPEAYVSAVVDVDGGLTDISLYQKNGNIMISSGDIYIYA